jgi:predicted lipid-binding transport protein (Tim44 family)
LIPIAPTNGGRIIGTRTAELRRPFRGKRNRSEITASGSAMRSASVVPAQARRNEFLRSTR